MTIAYYHGAPGSFKTSSMVKDWLLPSSEPPKRGFFDKILRRPQKPFNRRHVYTNIRGIQPTEYIHVVDSRGIIDSLFTAERGSLFLIDELGQVFDYVDARKYQHPSSGLQSDENGTIEIINTLPILFDKHRHFGYDIIGTAPSHKRVPVFFQSIAEFGYRHRALASAGLKGFYSQAEHLGQDNGSASQIIRSQIKKMPKRVFDFYQSTATGDHKESPISSSALTHPMIIFGFPFVACLLIYAYFSLSDMYDRRVTTAEEKAKLTGLTNDSKHIDTLDSPSGLPDSPVSKRGNGSRKIIVENHLQAKKAADYIDSFLSDDQSYIRLSYVTDSLSFFTFGTCEKSINLTFKRKGSLNFDKIHSAFNYNFETNKLKFKGETLYYAPSDCQTLEPDGIGDKLKDSDLLASN